MRNQPIATFVILAGASALFGCASVHTTEQYAALHGYTAIESQGREYFCHKVQPVAASSPALGTHSAGSPAARTRCLTRNQLVVVELSSGPTASFYDPPRSPVAFQEPMTCGGRCQPTGGMLNW